MDPHHKDGEHEDGKPLTLDKRYEIATEALRCARWSVRDVTDTEIKERIPHLPPSISDEFIFADEYVAQAGSGIWITPRGTLFIRMLDGL